MFKGYFVLLTKTGLKACITPPKSEILSLTSFDLMS